jgi:hypothetical protein
MVRLAGRRSQTPRRRVTLFPALARRPGYRPFEFTVLRFENTLTLTIDGTKAPCVPSPPKLPSPTAPKPSSPPPSGFHSEWASDDLNMESGLEWFPVAGEVEDGQLVGRNGTLSPQLLQISRGFPRKPALVIFTRVRFPSPAPSFCSANSQFSRPLSHECHTKPPGSAPFHWVFSVGIETVVQGPVTPLTGWRFPRFTAGKNMVPSHLVRWRGEVATAEIFGRRWEAIS